MLYIRRTLSCCICHVFHSVFSVYVHLMYIFLSLFSVDGFYCAILLDIVLICCCTPDNDIDSPSPDMGRHSVPPGIWPVQTISTVHPGNLHRLPPSHLTSRSQLHHCNLPLLKDQLRQPAGWP